MPEKIKHSEQIKPFDLESTARTLRQYHEPENTLEKDADYDFLIRLEPSEDKTAIIIRTKDNQLLQNEDWKRLDARFEIDKEGNASLYPVLQITFTDNTQIALFPKKNHPGEKLSGHIYLGTYDDPSDSMIYTFAKVFIREAEEDDEKEDRILGFVYRPAYAGDWIELIGVDVRGLIQSCIQGTQKAFELLNYGLEKIVK